MIGFKEWYETKHGPYPGQAGEDIFHMHRRLCDAIAEYVDLKTTVPRMRKVKWTPEIEASIQEQWAKTYLTYLDEDDGA